MTLVMICLLLFGFFFTIGYFLGNPNGAMICSGLLHHEDIRVRGSGNAGLTNYFRTYGSWDTLLVILIDAGKAVLACFVGKWLFQWASVNDTETLRLGSMLCGSAAVLGHCFPIIYGFRGGKGILTCAAVAAYMNIWVFLILLAVFAVTVLLTKYVSIGSIAACVVYPFLFWLFFPQNTPVLLIAAVTAFLDILMHRANIARLIAGTESKFSFPSAKA